MTNSRKGIARRRVFALLGGAAALLGLQGFVFAHGQSPVRKDAKGRVYAYQGLEPTRVQTAYRIMEAVMTMYGRLSLKLTGESHGISLPLPEAHDHPLNDMTPDGIYLATSVAWEEVTVPGQRQAPDSHVYRVATDWLIIQSFSPEKHTTVFTIVDWSDPGARVHPCTQKYENPIPFQWSTEGSCEGLDWTSHKGVPTNIRHDKTKAPQLGVVAAIATFFVPTLYADEGPPCGNSDPCQCRDNCGSAPEKYCKGQLTNCYSETCHSMGNGDYCCCVSKKCGGIFWDCFMPDPD